MEDPALQGDDVRRRDQAKVRCPNRVNVSPLSNKRLNLVKPARVRVGSSKLPSSGGEEHGRTGPAPYRDTTQEQRTENRGVTPDTAIRIDPPNSYPDAVSLNKELRPGSGPGATLSQMRPQVLRVRGNVRKGKVDSPGALLKLQMIDASTREL